MVKTSGGLTRTYLYIEMALKLNSLLLVRLDMIVQRHNTVGESQEIPHSY